MFLIEIYEKGVSGHFANVSLRKLSVRKRPRSIRKRIPVDSYTSSDYYFSSACELANPESVSII